MGQLFFNRNGLVEQPTVVLCSVGGKIYGEIPYIDDGSIQVVVNMNTANEISFDVDKYHNGVINPLWDKIIDFKIIWYKELNQAFVISVDINDKQGIRKHITGVGAGETELGQILLRNIEINTESDIGVENEDGTTNYESSTLYNPTNKKASIIDRMLDKAPHYSVDYVDPNLTDLWRPYSFNEKSIKDSFNEIGEDIGCMFVYNVCIQDGKLHRGIRVYDLMNKCRTCGERFDGDEACPECGSTDIKLAFGEDTGITIDKDNLAESITYSTDTDSVKNCFYLQAGDEYMTAVVHTCLPSNDGYLWYINDDVLDDMSDELSARITAYNEKYAEYTKTKVYDVSSPVFEELVTRYKDDTYNPVVYVGSTTGYSGVIDAYFNATTMRYYLQTSMMPTIATYEINAQTQCQSVVNGFGGEMATQNNISIMSADTAESMMKNMAKMWYSQSAYELTFNRSSWDNSKGEWKGRITLTSKVDATNDTYTSALLTIKFTQDYTQYLQQSLEKSLSIADNQDTGIVALFKKDDTDFSDALKSYSADCLSSFYEVSRTLLDLLIEQGVGDSNSYLYKDLYLPYYKKMRAIMGEQAVRTQEISNLDNYILGLEFLMDYVHSELDFNSFVGEDLMLEFAAYRRDDTYKNDNYISDGLTDSEVVENARQFVKSAEREIYKSATLQHTISANVYNLMLMQEFEGFLDKFEVGNWVHIIVDDKPYKLRLMSYTFNYGGLSNINVTFSDVKVVANGLSDIGNILSQAANMATSYNYVARNADKAKNGFDSFDSMFNRGLDLTNTKLLSDADNQEMTIDSHGLLMKRYDPIIDDYVDEQIKMTNTTIAFSNDDWETVKTAFGKYYDGDGNAMYGLIGENIIGKVIAGENLTITSSVKDGDGNAVFSVDEDGVSLRNSTFYVSCDEGAEIMIDPTYGFVIGKGALLDEAGQIIDENITLMVGTDGTLKLRSSSDDKDTKHVVNSVVYYSVSNSNTTIPDVPTDATTSGDSPTWTTTMPETNTSNEEREYVWASIKLEYDDGTYKWCTPYCVTDGGVVSSIEENKQLSNEIGVSVEDLNIKYTTEYNAISSEMKNVKDELELVMTSEEINIRFQNTENAIGNLEDSISSGIKTDGMSINEKNFTFDQDGLHISQSSDRNVGLCTTIDDNGMVVEYNGQERLSATNTGVVAVDLTAKNYLIIGNRSRFEDYGDSYTACFWIGG